MSEDRGQRFWIADCERMVHQVEFLRNLRIIDLYAMRDALCGYGIAQLVTRIEL